MIMKTRSLVLAVVAVAVVAGAARSLVLAVVAGAARSLVLAVVARAARSLVLADVPGAVVVQAVVAASQEVAKTCHPGVPVFSLSLGVHLRVPAEQPCQDITYDKFQLQYRISKLFVAAKVLQ
jgi:hypothetical protein